ncbi:MAG: type II toxin-antitoxin system HicA family toxin [Dehalococcoidia bacterium]|nr:MAG: type II toxin-antitoxin system HicA family toxin [Dehalococcoidia bacterium]
MRYVELTRKLRWLGCQFRRQAKSSHEIWWHPERKLYTVIPRRSGEIAGGTLLKILKDVDLAENDIRKA